MNDGRNAQIDNDIEVYCGRCTGRMVLDIKDPRNLRGFDCPNERCKTRVFVGYKKSNERSISTNRNDPFCNNCQKVLSKEEFESPIHSGHLIIIQDSSISNTERNKR